MSFAANPVADFFAPPPAQPVATKAADTSGPSFDDHLQAQAAHDARAKDARDARDEARGDRADRADAADRAADQADDADRANDITRPTHDDATQEKPASTAPEHDATESKAHVAHHAQTTPAPLAVQLIAAATAQTQEPETPAQQTPAANANAHIVTPPPEAPVIVAEVAPQPAQNATKKVATTKNPKVLPAEPSAETVAPQQTAQPAAAPVQPTTPVTATLKSEGDAKSSIAPVTDAPARETAPHGAKPEATPKFEPQKSAPEVPSSTDTNRSEPVAANATKASAATAAHAAASAANDAPASTPAQGAMPAMAAAPMQAPVQAQHAAVVADQSGLRVAPAASQVGHEIVRRFDGGNTSFDIRLDPPELGRVDVRLEVSRDQRVTATISADNPQALHELARHARDLQQTLQSAGLELADNGLSFDLRQGGDNRQQANNDSASSSQNARNAEAQPEQQAAVTRPRFESWRGVRLDMMV